MKVQEHTIQVERKDHPNATRYPCRSTHEVLEAGRKLLTSLPPADLDLLSERQLIVDEEDTEELFDEFKENDIIGLGVVKPDGFYANTYRIEKIHKGEDWMECENAYTKLTEEISFQDVSVGMALGFAEILYRDDKPFGVSSHYDFTIKYEVDEVEDEEEDNSGNSTASAGRHDGSADAKREGTVERIEENSTTSETSKEVSESAIEPSLDFNECCYAFGFDASTMTHYVVITPIKLWNDENLICNQGSADHLAKKLGLLPFKESMYEYEHQYNESQLRQLMTAFRAQEITALIA